jgi:uncharacterized membrane protein
VTARFLLGFFDTIYLIALTAWLGSILFFSFCVAPLIFKVLGSESGGKFVRALFPRYYAWGAIAGAVALPSFVAVPLCYPEYRGPTVAIQSTVILVCTLLMLYAGNSLTPAINAARDAGLEGRERFDRLHRRSVRLNALVLILGLGLLIAYAHRPAPKTSGITELSPSEQGPFDAELNRVIEQTETKYGFRAADPDASASPANTQSALDPEMLKEIDSYYQQKRARVLARRGSGVR